MKKTTIELDRMKRHWSGWGIMNDKWGGDGDKNPLVLNALIKWSKRYPRRKIYRHVMWGTEENKDKEPTMVETSYKPQCPVHYCDRVIYLDIYYQ
jgi:hypothetical protein